MVKAWKGFKKAIAMGLMTAAVFSVASQAPALAAKKKLIIYWHQGGEALVELRKIVDSYERQNPGIDITVTLGEGDWNAYYQKFLIMMAAGAQMDLCQIDMQYVPFAKKGIFADLSPYIKRSKVDTGDISKVAWKAYSMNGKQYGFPWASFPCPLVYNKKMFAEAGLSPLSTDWTEKAFTMQAAELLAAKLTKDTNGDGKNDIYGIGQLWDFQKSFGAEWLNEANKPIANSPENIAAFKWYTGLVRDTRVRPSEEDTTRLKMPWERFSSGKIGFATMGVYQFPDYSKLKFPWAVAVAPMKNTRVIPISVDAIGLGSNSKYKEEAWKFIKYMADTDSGLTKLAGTMCGVPVQKQTWGKYFEGLAKKYSAVNWDCVTDSVEYGAFSSLYFSGRYGALDAIIRAESALMESGKKSVTQALDDIQKKLLVEMAKK